MKLAEELAERVRTEIWLKTGQLNEVDQAHLDWCVAAINEAIERCAQEADEFKQKFDKAGEIAARIRKLKSA